MDMRYRAYPSLPEGKRLRLVLPRTGDLRYRSQIPAAFAKRLYIHADPRRRFWYARFQLKRKFIVMTTQGDLYTKECTANFTIADLPSKNVLSMPRVARGDLVKVLDLVQCSRSEGHQWELVFTRWRNGMETWLPMEVVQLLAPNLLQELYVSSINSWAFHSRIQPGILLTFRTEVELWLFHPEFQDFYKKLYKKRTDNSTATSRPQQQAALALDQGQVKPERQTGSVQASHTLQRPQAHASIASASTASDSSERLIQEFEQRRLARERQEQIDRARINRLNQQLQQQYRLEGEQQVRNARLRQVMQEETQKRQKECQQQLNAQQEREKAAKVQQELQEKQLQAKKHEELQRKKQQETSNEANYLQNQAPTRRRSQETTTQTQLQHKEGQTGALSPSLRQPVRKKSSSIWAKNDDEDYVPPEESDESDHSIVCANTKASEDSTSVEPRKRHRKRLLYSQLQLDDEDDNDDELPDLSQLPLSAHQRSQSTIEDDLSSRKSCHKNKKRKKIRKLIRPKENETTSSNVDVDLTQFSDDNNDQGNNSVKVPAVIAPVITDDSDTETSYGDGKVAIELVSDETDDDDVNFEPSIVRGEIRCVCGTTSAEGYCGQWLQCWNEECGVWEHADCVGILTHFETRRPLKYLCARCDPEAYVASCAKASQRIMDWLFQCCDSRNVKQLMQLLNDDTGAVNLPSDWKNPRYENRTLAMHAARNGLVQCLCYLLDERKVDIFATDLQSRNALHHAAQGGSVGCCQVLLKHDRKLLLHPDLHGCMPFHWMLQSAKVNKLCVSFIREDAALVGMGDLDCNYPLHYACQAVNRYTVKICRMIFAAQSSMLHKKSREGLHPLMILCKSAGPVSTNSMRNNASEMANSAKEVVSLMLDIDVFGDCLNEKAPNGWLPLHFAAASGSHELITQLCNTRLFDVNYAVKGSGQTALHIAAQEKRSLAVRALLVEGLSVVAKDSDGVIPMLYTEDAACIQEFLHFKLTKQLSRLHRMLGKYQQRELVRRWQRIVARDPICFDMLNDWCHHDMERMERMEGLLLSSPFLLRLDNKIEYVWTKIIPSIKGSPRSCSSIVGMADTDKHQKKQKKVAFVFSRAKGSFWKQFVDMGMRLEPEDFRLPLLFSIDRSGANSQENHDSNLKVILIRLAAGLLKEVPGLLLVRGSSPTCQFFLSPDKQVLTVQLLGFYLLGELIAHLVLFAVPISGIFDFDIAFLRCIGCRGKHKLTRDDPWKTAGCAFVAGFEAVLPATLALFHAEDLRVLFNGPEISLNALQIDWDTAIEWKVCGSKTTGDKKAASARTWLPRLMGELVEEEQQLVLLFMTGTFQQVNDHFFRSGGESGRISVASYAEPDGMLDHDATSPTMEHDSDTLRVPSYSCYEFFKKGMLRVIRHVDYAFLPE